MTDFDPTIIDRAMPFGPENDFVAAAQEADVAQAFAATPETNPSVAGGELTVDQAREGVQSIWAANSQDAEPVGTIPTPPVTCVPTGSVEAGEAPKKSKVREATEADLDRLATIDLMMFENAYGQDIPTHAEVKEMLAKRLVNVQGGGGHMMVCEADGEVNGFSTFFKTNKTWDQFTSWEDATNNGTLDGVVHSEGKYAYVANMTVTPKGSEVRAMQKIMVNLISAAMKEGVEYGFFVSRIPQFTKWLKETGIDYTQTSTEVLDQLAQEYVDKTEISKKGKEEPYDYELRVYTRSGFEKGKLVNAGFSDDESLCYGVTFRVPVPLAGKPKMLRAAAASVFSLGARSTKLIDKLF